MTTQTTSTTTTQPVAFSSQMTSQSQEAVHFTNTVLSQTEQMNNQVLADMNKTLETFKTMLEKMQKSQEAVLQENQLLKKETIQLNTTLKENEKLYAAEIKAQMQTIQTLANSVNTLKSDLSSTKQTLNELNEKFELLAISFNSHGHDYRAAYEHFLCTTAAPSTPYQPPKKETIEPVCQFV